jgi:hypothetical protein
MIKINIPILATRHKNSVYLLDTNTKDRLTVENAYKALNLPLMARPNGAMEHINMVEFLPVTVLDKTICFPKQWKVTMPNNKIFSLDVAPSVFRYKKIIEIDMAVREYLVNLRTQLFLLKSKFEREEELIDLDLSIKEND